MRAESMDLVSIPEWWRADCQGWIETERLSWEEVGRRLADHLDRAKPYNRTSIWRYLTGQLNSLELTEGFARARGVQSPLLVASDPDLVQWLAVGVALRREDIDMFFSLMRQARALITMP